MSEFKPGVYRHFKGGLYFAMVEAVCTDAEPLEGTPFIVYVSASSGQWSVRSSASFLGEAEPGVPRFRPIDEEVPETDESTFPSFLFGPARVVPPFARARYLQSPDAGRSAGQKP